jgi:NitT/TauT family transport system ATP-binding protein
MHESNNTEATEPFIRVRDVRKTYRNGGSETPAIANASFDVWPNELVALVGPSGCGKTTLLRIIAGLETFDQGTVSIGTSAHPFEPARDIGIVFQQPLLLKWRTVQENVLLPAEILGLPERESRSRALDLLNMVGLRDFQDRYPYELSGGMQQRAALARALIHDPKLIVMDEPFGALDALTREKMNLELLEIWKKSHKTILFVTHSIAEAVLLGTRVIVLTAGPGRLADNFRVELTEPRVLNLKSTEAFGRYSQRIYHLLGMN